MLCSHRTLRQLALVLPVLTCHSQVFYIIEGTLVWISVGRGNGKAINLVTSQHLDHLQRVCNARPMLLARCVLM